MEQLDINNYVPPFITETDETRWDDCTVCSTLMAVASATTGEAVSNKNWSTMNKSQLKVLRERIRNHLGPGDQIGGTTMADMRIAFAKEYPWLPQIPSYAEQDNQWDDARRKLLDGYGGVYMGNPSLVTNVNSKLRRWTNNDDFGHAIWVDRARKDESGDVEFYVMDPLGRGEYDGDWVPENELKEFTWLFDATNGYRYITLFKRGLWNSDSAENKRLLDTIKELNSKIDALQVQIVDAQKARDAAIILRDASLARLRAANEKIRSLQARIKSLSVQVDKLKDRIAKLTK